MKDKLIVIGITSLVTYGVFYLLLQVIQWSS